MMRIVCLNCGHPFPDVGVPYQCPRCGGLFDDLEPLSWRGADNSQPGIFRHLSSREFGARLISLEEGNTPLIAARIGEREVYFKCEYANPTGSFKDRGMAALMSFLHSRAVGEALEDSSGNAGAAFAAYAARAGIHAKVFMPASASGIKRRQIEAYGAELVPVPGPRSEATLAARKAADGGMVYASHAYLPQVLPGYGTCAFELYEQLGGAPGAVLVPAGQGGLLLGVARGFVALQRAGAISKLPMLIGVQAAACAPLAAYSEIGVTGLSMVTDGETVAEGVRTRSPLRIDAVVRAVQETGGRFVAVQEPRILAGRDALARMGFYVEPTSALVWAAMQDTLGELADPVVAVLTGSGYKTQL